MTTKLEVRKDGDGEVTSIIMDGVVYSPPKKRKSKKDQSIGKLSSTLTITAAIPEEEEEIPVVSVPQNQQSGPRPAPLNNHRTTNSFNLFEGISWGG